MRKWIVALILLLAGFLPQTGLAQEVDRNPSNWAGEPTICVVPLTRWVSSPEETARIKSVPVPETFTRRFEGKICNTLDPAGLLDWHLAFGDEDTIQAALAYYASQWISDPIEPAKYGAALELAWELARPRYEAVNRFADERREEAEEVRMHDGRILQLSRLLAIAGSHEAVLRYLLHAADFYKSPSLLAKAEGIRQVIDVRNAFLDSNRAAFAALARSRPEDPRNVGVDSHSLLLPYRLASARYRITGAGFDRATVRARVVGPYAKAVEEAAKFAWMEESWGDIEKTYLDALKAADQAENNFLHFAVQVLREDVLIDFTEDAMRADGKCEPKSFSEVMILMEKFEKDGHDEGFPLGYDGHSYPRDFRDMRLQLLLAKAACLRSTPKEAATAAPQRDVGNVFYSLFETLEQARQLVQPDESSSRFRQVAQAYLAAGALCRATSPATPAGERPENCHASNRRLETYFHINLQALDAIAVAAMSSP